MTYPIVSVIMPVRNEAAFIAQSLEAVLNQTYPTERLELLLVDGISRDQTIEVVSSLPGAERVQILCNAAHGQAAALNLGLKQAKGEIVIRVDGHTVIAPDYVEQCIEALRRSGAAAVGGMLCPVGVTPMGKAIAAAMTSRFAVPSAFRISDREQYTDTVYLGAWPRAVLERLGGFNERVGVNEDYELNYRIRQTGSKVLLSPRINSKYYGRQTLNALAKQYFYYGYSKAKMWRQHPASLRVRHLMAPMFVVILIAGLMVTDPLVRLAWLTAFIGYLGLDVLFSISIARCNISSWSINKQSLIVVAFLPVIFPVVHLTWGCGFWFGLLTR